MSRVLPDGRRYHQGNFFTWSLCMAQKLVNGSFSRNDCVGGVVVILKIARSRGAMGIARRARDSHARQSASFNFSLWLKGGFYPISSSLLCDNCRALDYLFRVNDSFLNDGFSLFIKHFASFFVLFYPFSLLFWVIFSHSFCAQACFSNVSFLLVFFFGEA